MPGFVREHLRPLAGAASLHVILLAALGVAALRWKSEQPPVQLAIEGVVVDARDLPTVNSRPSQEVAPPPVEPEPQPVDEQAAAAEKARLEREAVEREQTLRREQEAEQAQAAERQRVLETEERARAEARANEAAAEAARKAEAAAKARAEAEDKRRKEAEHAEAQRQAAREAELRRSLAAEDEAAAVARSGVVDEYRRMLIEVIERNWNRPPSARAGLECTLYVTQAPGGTVLDVKLGACNGDQAVKESITNAVFRSSPLPAPRDARAFERRLEIVFKPTE